MKSIDELSPRLQRYRMRMMRYTYRIEHVPGKNFYTPDTWSGSRIHLNEDGYYFYVLK